MKGWTPNNRKFLTFVTWLHYLYFGYVGLSCTKGICPLMYLTTLTHLQSLYHPECLLNLQKISPVFIARSNRLMQKRFKVIFFIRKLQVKCMPQNQFHLSPNEAFTDSVSKLWCNKLLPANINEICWLVAKQVNLSMTGFHDQVRSRRKSQSFMQQEGSSDKLWLLGYCCKIYQ